MYKVFNGRERPALAAHSAVGRVVLRFPWFLIPVDGTRTVTQPHTHKKAHGTSYAPPQRQPGKLGFVLGILGLQNATVARVERSPSSSPRNGRRGPLWTWRFPPVRIISIVEHPNGVCEYPTMHRCSDHALVAS